MARVTTIVLPRSEMDGLVEALQKIAAETFDWHARALAEEALASISRLGLPRAER